jgi:hypothetical protein
MVLAIGFDFSEPKNIKSQPYNPEKILHAAAEHLII